MSTAEQEIQKPESASASVYSCDHCGSVPPKGMMSWCPDCGYYPEIERFRMEEPAPEELDVEDQPKVRWRWIHTAYLGVFIIFLITCAGRVFYNYCDADPAYWTLIQAAWGFIFMVTAHVSAGLFAMGKSPKHNPVSWFINPFETWVPLMEENSFQKRLSCLFYLWLHDWPRRPSAAAFARHARRR